MVNKGPRLDGYRYRRGIRVKGASGFSLAELLVVMAIIAILAGILVPVLLQAQEGAKMRSCVANLKELGTSFRMYLDDNNGYSIPGPRTVDWTLRVNPLFQYTKQPPVKPEGHPKRVWICPGDKGRAEEPPRWRFNEVSFSSYWYPYNAYLATQSANVADTHTDVAAGFTAPNTPRRPELWMKPTRDILLRDWGINFHKGVKDSTESAAKCVNCLMLDGHVVSVAVSDTERVSNYAIYYDNPYSKLYNPSVE